MTTLDARAWFFFIPGELIDAVGDALTGSEGKHCVAPNAKVGDRITVPTGGAWTVKTISGTSSRCTNPALPIRALLVPSTEAEQSTQPVTATPKTNPVASRAGLRLQDGWEPMPLLEPEAARGIVLSAINRSTDARLTLYSERREGVLDMASYSEAQRASQAAMLVNSQATAIVPLEVNGLPAWRFEVTGVAYNDARYTYLVTVIDAGSEILRVIVMSTESDHLSQRPSIERLAFGVTGFSPPPATPAKVATLSVPPSDARVGLRLPVGWEATATTERDQAAGVILNAINRNTESRLALFVHRREGVTDVAAFAGSKREWQASHFSETQKSEVVPLMVNGVPAWRYKVSGTSYSNIRYTYLHTVVDAGTELLLLSTWTIADRFDAQRPALEKLVEGLTGIASPTPSATLPPPTSFAISESSSVPNAGAVPSGIGTPPGAITTPASGPAQRLRDLNGIFKEGLINKKEYEEKKKKILESL